MGFIFTNIESFAVAFVASDCDAGKATTGLVHPQSGLGISPKLILGGASRNSDPSPIVLIFGGSAAIIAVIVSADCDHYHTGSG